MARIKGWKKVNKTTWKNIVSGTTIRFGKYPLGWKAILDRKDYSFPDWNFKKYIDVDGDYTIANYHNKETLWKLVKEWMKTHPNGFEII